MSAEIKGPTCLILDLVLIHPGMDADVFECYLCHIAVVVANNKYCATLVLARLSHIPFREGLDTGLLGFDPM